MSTQTKINFIGDLPSKTKKDGLILKIESVEFRVAFQKHFSKIICQTSYQDLKHRKSMISWIEDTD